MLATPEVEVILWCPVLTTEPASPHEPQRFPLICRFFLLYSNTKYLGKLSQLKGPLGREKSKKVLFRLLSPDFYRGKQDEPFSYITLCES